jgi:hypothetical protein
VLVNNSHFRLLGYIVQHLSIARKGGSYIHRGIKALDHSMGVVALSERTSFVLIASTC